MNLIGKYCDNIIPECQHDTVFKEPYSVENLISGIREDMQTVRERRNPFSYPCMYDSNKTFCASLTCSVH